MNKDQKHFLARAVEITAFGQFAALGYPAFMREDWASFFISCIVVLILLLAAYVILSIKTGGSK